MKIKTEELLKIVEKRYPNQKPFIVTHSDIRDGKLVHRPALYYCSGESYEKVAFGHNQIKELLRVCKRGNALKDVYMSLGTKPKMVSKERRSIERMHDSAFQINIWVEAGTPYRKIARMLDEPYSSVRKYIKKYIEV